MNNKDKILYCNSKFFFDEELYAEVTVKDIGVCDIPKDVSCWNDFNNYNTIVVTAEFPKHFIPSWDEIQRLDHNNVFTRYLRSVDTYTLYVRVSLKLVTKSLKFALDEVIMVVNRIKSQRNSFMYNLKLREETINASKIELENLDVNKMIADAFHKNEV